MKHKSVTWKVESVLDRFGTCARTHARMYSLTHSLTHREVDTNLHNRPGLVSLIACFLVVLMSILIIT